MTPTLQHEVEADLAKHYQIAAANAADAIQGKNPPDEILQQGRETP